MGACRAAFLLALTAVAVVHATIVEREEDLLATSKCGDGSVQYCCAELLNGCCARVLKPTFLLLQIVRCPDN